MPLAFVSPFHLTNGGPPHSHPYLSTLSQMRRVLTFTRDVVEAVEAPKRCVDKKDSLHNLIHAAAVYGLFPNSGASLHGRVIMT